MQKPQASSSFSALANVAFSRLWVAALASGTAVAADQTAARWALIHFSESCFIISLLSSTAALPFLLFTLPAGFLADAVDRRPLLRTINVWQALVAGALAFLGFRGMLSPATLLVGSLALGVGFAFNAPVWTPLIPDAVPEDELPSAATLGSLQMNFSGIVGSALGGFLLAVTSPPFVFGLNAVGFLGVVAALRSSGARRLKSSGRGPPCWPLAGCLSPRWHSPTAGRSTHWTSPRRRPHAGSPPTPKAFGPTNVGLNRENDSNGILAGNSVSRSRRTWNHSLANRDVSRRRAA